MSDQERTPVAGAVCGGETPFEPEPAEHAG
jgi:hypothetical protein